MRTEEHAVESARPKEHRGILTAPEWLVPAPSTAPVSKVVKVHSSADAKCTLSAVVECTQRREEGVRGG